MPQPQWEVMEIGECYDCQKVDGVYRVTAWGKYDRTNAQPQWRCRKYAEKKLQTLCH